MECSTLPVRVSRSIIASAMTDTSIVIVDTTPAIYTYTTSGKFHHTSTLKKFRSFPGRYGHAATISTDGKLSMVCDTLNDRVMLIDVNTNKVLRLFHITAPEICIFSPDNSLLAIGNSLGKVVWFSASSYTMLGEISLSDSINALLFSPDNQNIFLATHDKKLHHYMLKKHFEIHCYPIDDIIETMVLSSDTNHLTAYTRKGNSYIFNLAMKKFFLGDPCCEWPTNAVHIPESEIVLLGTRSNQMFINTVCNGTKLGSVTLDFWGITAISVHNQKVFIGFSDGNGTIIDVAENIGEAKRMLDTCSFSSLSLLAKSQPLIFIDAQLCLDIQKNHIELFEYKPVNHDEKVGYDALCAIALCNTVQRQTMLSCLYTSEDIVPFMLSYSKGEIQTACTHAYDAPLLRQLREFKEIRTNCQSNLRQQIKRLENDDISFQNAFEELPEECNRCVHNVLPPMKELDEAYKDLSINVAKNNYSKVMEITASYPIFRQTLIYRRLMNHGELLINRILNAMSLDNMSDAYDHACRLTQYKPFEATGKDFQNHIKAYKMFVSSCQKKDLQKIFLLAEEYPAFRTTPMFKEELDYYHNNIFTPALTQARLGEPKQVQMILASYWAVVYFQEKNLTLLRMSLLNEIRRFAPPGEELSLLNHYYTLFGWDKMYEKVCSNLGCIASHDHKAIEISDEYKTIQTLLTQARFNGSKEKNLSVS
jgi:hypothetical protein